MLHIRDPLRTTALQQRISEGQSIPLDNPIQIRNTGPWNTMQLMQQQVSDHAPHEGQPRNSCILSRTTQLRS